VAVKILKNDLSADNNKQLLDEVAAMSQINHLNIVNVLMHGSNTYVKTSGKTKDVHIIVLELAPGGEFFDFMAGEAYGEAAACYYFK
jgi:serine/threonine protein kinase